MAVLDLITNLVARSTASRTGIEVSLTAIQTINLFPF